MRQDIRDAFEASVDAAVSEFGRPKSDRDVRQKATLLMKQVERLIENMPDQEMSLSELYQEIAGQAWHG